MATTSSSQPTLRRGSVVGLAAIALLFLSIAGVSSSSLIDEACATTSYPDLCKSTLKTRRDSRTATTPRALAEAAIRAASDAGAAAAVYARAQLAVAKDNAMWQCLNDCADDVEEAVSHLDDTEGGVYGAEAKFKDVRLFLDTAERDSWSCDEACKYAPDTSVRGALLSQNKVFENMMNVTHALIKQATGGGDKPAPAPAPMPGSVP